MSNRVLTDPQRRVNNPADPIGQSIQMNDACVYFGVAGPGQAKNLIPNNGEYSWAGTTGNCNACTTCAPKLMKDSSGCNWTGNCGVVGTIPQYKRVSYNADPGQCCLGNGVNTVGNQTCDPKYRTGVYSPDCNDYYTNYCRIGDEIFTNPKCIQWSKIQQTDADSILNEKCVGDHLKTDICTKWCLRNPSTCKANTRSYCQSDKFENLDNWCVTKAIEFGGMDYAVQQFCASHADVEFCSCYKASSDSGAAKDPTLKAILARPECYITKCASGGGYKNTNMRSSGACPSVNVCQNTLNAFGNTTTDLQNITQSCTQSQQSDTRQSDTRQSDTAAATSNFSNYIIFMQGFTWILLFIGVIILTLVGNLGVKKYYKHLFYI